MKFTHLALLIGTAALASACTATGSDNTCDTSTGASCDTDGASDSDTNDTTDTDVVDVSPLINDGAWAGGWDAAGQFIDCGTAGHVKFHAETKNWGGAVQLYITQTTVYGDSEAWDEAHTLDETPPPSPDNDGAGWSIYDRDLTTGATLATQGADESTLWVCGNVDPSLDPTAAKLQTSFALAVWAPNEPTTDAPSDCVYFGQDPDEMVNDGYTGGTGNPHGRTLPTWLTASACRKLP